MKKLAMLVTVVALVVTAPFCFAQEVMTNADVLELHRAGLPAPVIITKIQSSRSTFDTTTESLVMLGKAGVPAEVITAMMNGGGAVPAEAPQQFAQPGRLIISQTAAPAANTATNFRGTPCPAPGLFADTGSGRLEKLQPRSATSSGGSSGVVSHLAKGVIGQKSYVFLAGTRSRTQLPTSRLTFLFCFEEAEGGMSYQTSGATIPDDFVLAHFDVRAEKDKRRLQVGNIHRFKGNKTGVPDDDRVSFEVEEITTGVYRVTPTSTLTSGEYAFYYAAELGTAVFGISMGDSGKFFDFGVGGNSNSVGGHEGVTAALAAADVAN